jgi:hypothetical protein
MTTKKKSKSSLPRLPVNLQKQFAKEIRATWQKTLESIIETGKLLIRAQHELPYGSFEGMITSELPFKRQTAYRLMSLAKHPVISDVSHVIHLPAHYSTLLELAKVDEHTLIEKIEDGTVTPKTDRKQAIALRRYPADPPHVTGGKRSNARGKYILHLKCMEPEEILAELKHLSILVNNMKKGCSLSVEASEEDEATRHNNDNDDQETTR